MFENAQVWFKFNFAVAVAAMAVLLIGIGIAPISMVSVAPFIIPVVLLATINWCMALHVLPCAPSYTKRGTGLACALIAILTGIIQLLAASYCGKFHCGRVPEWHELGLVGMGFLFVGFCLLLVIPTNAEFHRAVNEA